MRQAVFDEILTKIVEILRENQRLIRRSQREIDRERVALQRQEKQITVEIKQMAKQNQMVNITGPFTYLVSFPLCCGDLTVVLGFSTHSGS